MSTPSQPSENALDRSEDLAFQRRWWIVERVGWLLMFLAVLAGATGLLGRGPASRAEIIDGPTSLEYERFARLQAPSYLRLKVLQLVPTAEAREVLVAISHDYCSQVRVVDITPTPESSSTNEEGLTYHFRLEPGQVEVPIDFKLQMETLGKLEGWLRVGDQSPLRFSQFVYP